MGETIIIDPVTRISGFLEIRVEVEKDTIIDANASGLLFRGFEKMLTSRAPLDAIYFTQRICGICSTAHAMASSLALEKALNIEVALNNRYIRDILHGFEFIQNHLRHFYLLTMPSYAKISALKLASDQQYSDFRLPQEINRKIEENYIKSIELSRLAHEALAVLGGKAPHNHGVFVGGVTVIIDAYKLEKIRSIVRRIKAFVMTQMIEDAYNIAKYYCDYFEKGISYPYFMSYGVYDYEDPDISYVKPCVMKDGVRYPFDAEKISEQIRYSWYVRDHTSEEVDLYKPDAYSFIKSPRYDTLSMEVGPLARLMITGEYTKGYSCMDRIFARVLETQKIVNIVERLIDRVELQPNNQMPYTIPEKAYGAGLVDTARGALGHWLEITDKVIHHYNIITPSVWNLSPKDITGLPGVVERALIGSKINNLNEPVEIGRIVRSFDPCVSCATHLIGEHLESKIIEVLV